MFKSNFEKFDIPVSNQSLLAANTQRVSCSTVPFLTLGAACKDLNDPTRFELVEYTRKTCHLVPLFDQVLLFRSLYCAMFCNKREVAVQASVLWISSLGTKIENTIDLTVGKAARSWFEQPALSSTYIFVHMYVLRTVVATATRTLIFIYLLLLVFEFMNSHLWQAAYLLQAT